MLGLPHQCVKRWCSFFQVLGRLSWSCKSPPNIPPRLSAISHHGVQKSCTLSYLKIACGFSSQQCRIALQVSALQFRELDLSKFLHQFCQDVATPPIQSASSVLALTSRSVFLGDFKCCVFIRSEFGSPSEVPTLVYEGAYLLNNRWLVSPACNGA